MESVQNLWQVGGGDLTALRPIRQVYPGRYQQGPDQQGKSQRFS